MKNKFVDHGIEFISKYQECNDLKIKQLKYGLEGIYNLFVKLTVVIIISIITKTVKETCLFLLFYSGIRTFSYGIHAKSNILCWITTIIIYNVIPLLCKTINIPKNIGYLIILISFISVLLWAPADTPKKPLIRKNQRLKCKVLALLVIMCYTIIYFFNNISIITNACLYALLVETICINPLTYKLTKTTFNNYKYYKKKNINTV